MCVRPRARPLCVHAGTEPLRSSMPINRERSTCRSCARCFKAILHFLPPYTPLLLAAILTLSPLLTPLLAPPYPVTPPYPITPPSLPPLTLPSPLLPFQVVKAMKMDISEDQLKGMMKEADNNHNGQVTWSYRSYTYIQGHQRHFSSCAHAPRALCARTLLGHCSTPSVNTSVNSVNR